MRRRRDASAAFDVVQQAAAPRVEEPGDRNAGHVEDQEAPQRRFRAAGQRDRRAVALRDEEGAVGRDRRGEADDRRRFLLRLTDALGRVELRLSRGISSRMIAGIIWKVDALPTPVAKNSNMNIAKKPQKASG